METSSIPTRQKVAHRVAGVLAPGAPPAWNETFSDDVVVVVDLDFTSNLAMLAAYVDGHSYIECLPTGPSNLLSLCPRRMRREQLVDRVCATAAEGLDGVVLGKNLAREHRLRLPVLSRRLLFV